jgi:general stress protein 26
VPTGGEHNFTENGTVLSWQNISSLGWLIGGSEQMRLTSTGLGIGTSSPGVKLDVSTSGAGGISAFRVVNTDTTASSPVLALWSTADDGTQRNRAAIGSGADGTNNGYLYFSTRTSGSLTEKLRLDSSGNLGLGVTPSAWSGVGAALQVGTSAAIIGNSVNSSSFISNAYFDGANYRYIGTGFAMRLALTSGAYAFTTAPSGTAGNTISFTQAMTLTAAGDLGVGTTSPGSRLDVVGSATTSGINVSVSNASTSGQFPSTNYLLKTYDGSAVTNVGALGGTSSTFSYQQVSANQLNLTAYRAGGLRISTANSGPIIFAPTTGADPDFATEVMRITPAGNLGIGTTSPTGKIATQVTASGTFQNAFVASDGTSSDLLVKIRTNETQIMNSGASVLSFGTNNTERARITAAGELLVGTATSGGYLFRVNDGVSQFTQATSATDCADFWNRATSGDNKFVAFYTETSATSRGSITYNRAGGLVAYNVTSDYRAKDIIGPVQNSGAIIDALKVYEGQMKGATQSRPMLVAHEAQEHAPYAVTGEKDAVNEDGTPKYQQMDVSALVPLLLAEIQSLRARVAQLETK